MVPVDGYAVNIHRSWAEVPEPWPAITRAGRATPFQTETFLDGWYGVFGSRAEAEPLIVEMFDPARGGPALLLPLVRRKRGALTEIGFADNALADTNAPLPGPALPRGRREIGRMWTALRASLPPADVLHLPKMPRLVGGAANPLAGLPWAFQSRLSIHPLALPDAWETYVRSREKHFRKEQARAERVFLRHEGPRFDLLEDVDTALDILDGMNALQSERMRRIGVAYQLDEPDVHRFYSDLLRRGLRTGCVVLGALRAGPDLIGGLMGVGDGRKIAFVRIAHAGGEWSNSSPGRLVIELTLRALHARGHRHFDFSIGDHRYKDGFGVASEPLVDVVMPLSARGMPYAIAERAKALARRSTMLMTLKQRFAPKTA